MNTSKKSTRKNRRKSSKMVSMNRYAFNAVFATSPTGLLYPKVNILINGLRYLAFYNIPQGTTFGGLNLYSYVGRDIIGTFDPATRTLTMLGFA